MRKGWFKIPGVQDGDRTGAEQLLGLQPALGSARGKSVLDLGSAEGLIAAEFARAGAAHVLGVELLQDHVDVARVVCKDLPQVLFHCEELGAYIGARPKPPQYDIVLALGIAHKLLDPGVLLAFAARSCGGMLVFRGPGKDKFWDGMLRAKFGGKVCHVPTLLKRHGLVEGETLDSAHGERVQYWRRKS